jgi:hypothetical protein
MAQAQLRAASFLKTQKGKDKLSLHGFRYIIDKKSGTTTYWKCEVRDCRGRVIQCSEDYSESKEHNHAPDAALSVVSSTTFDSM